MAESVPKVQPQSTEVFMAKTLVTTTKKTVNESAECVYRKLVYDIGSLYEKARNAWTAFAWETGCRIVEVEQHGAVRAKYGSNLLQNLSADLTARYGNGFSADNLERMRSLYQNNPISAPARKLTWTNQIELMRVKDGEKRKFLTKKAEQEGLTKYQLRPLIKAANNSDGKGRPAKELPPLVRPAVKDLKLNTYKLAKPEVAALSDVPAGSVLVDCGFYVNRAVPKAEIKPFLAEVPSYTYAARVMRVVDGDTLVVVIDPGFGNRIEEKLRLRGIDTPELSEPEGKLAKKYVVKLLPAGSLVVFKSHKCKTDLHGRFVADLFYGGKTFGDIIGAGNYLNQDLLDTGYAKRVPE
jgi:endonuclease YncB( thermonuclease family)